MGKRTWIAAAALAGIAAAAISTQASAQTHFGVQIGIPAPVYVTAPPAPRYEYVPAARHGYFWVPGHWEWQGNGHVWVRGHHVRARSGYYYQPVQWYRDGDRWAYRQGGWHRGDRDRDGIPDRYDRDRDNDGMANRYDRDRDGDGVPNRRDRAPDNRYRN
jgi:hypothetical protein